MFSIGKKSENVDEQKEYKPNSTPLCFSLNPFEFIRTLMESDFYNQWIGLHFWFHNINIYMYFCLNVGIGNRSTGAVKPRGYTRRSLPLVGLAKLHGHPPLYSLSSSLSQTSTQTLNSRPTRLLYDLTSTSNTSIHVENLYFLPSHTQTPPNQRQNPLIPPRFQEITTDPLSHPWLLSLSLTSSPHLSLDSIPFIAPASMPSPLSFHGVLLPRPHPFSPESRQPAEWSLSSLATTASAHPTSPHPWPTLPESHVSITTWSAKPCFKSFNNSPASLSQYSLADPQKNETHNCHMIQLFHFWV